MALVELGTVPDAGEILIQGVPPFDEVKEKEPAVEPSEIPIGAGVGLPVV